VSERIKQWVNSTESIEQGTPPEEFSKGFVQMALSSSPPAHYVSGKLSWHGVVPGPFCDLHAVMDGLFEKASGLNDLSPVMPVTAAVKAVA